MPSGDRYSNEFCLLIENLFVGLAIRQSEVLVTSHTNNARPRLSSPLLHIPGRK
jgi:hypothetical protein